MRLFIIVYIIRWLSTALSGCIINLIVCISCSFTSNMLCPFLTLQEAFRQICIIPIHVIVVTRKICASKILRIFPSSSLFMQKKLDNVIIYINRNMWFRIKKFRIYWELKGKVERCFICNNQLKNTKTKQENNKY